MPLFDHFSWVAPHYDRIFRLSSIHELCAHLALEPWHRLLDVGGGTGRVAEHVVGSVAQVYVLDPSPAMLREGRRKGLDVAQGESERLPFGAGMFDRIIVVDVFHHLRDQQIAARELMRVLAHGGRLVIQEPDVTCWGVKLVWLAEKMLLMHSHFRSPEVMRALFEQAGGRTRIQRQRHTAWIVVDKS